MNVLDLRIAAVAARQDNVFTRSDVFACRGSQKAIVQRSRRIEPVSVVQGIRVTSSNGRSSNRPQ